MRSASELRQGERVHVIERRCNQIAMALEIGREPRLHHPDVTLVRKNDAFGQSRRSGCVKKHRRLAVLRNDRLELAGIDEAAEAVITLRTEHHGGQTIGTVLAARSVAKHQLCAGVLQDEMNGL